MSIITTIDTLQFSSRMQKAGLKQEVANELAEAIKETHSQSLEFLASKQDIFEVKKDLDLLKKDLQIIEQKLTIKLGSLITIAVTILAALIKLQ